MRRDQFLRRPKFVRDLGTDRKINYDGDYVPVSYVDSAAFKSYVKSIENLMKRSKHGVTTAEIHAALGAEHRAWTLEAIRYVEDVQESRTINPVRYSIQRKRIVRNAYGSIPAVKKVMV